jgi:two-component system chemotaxis sensor kinase CheA
LVHVVRNAVDHGLEPPQERAAAGKPARPKLRLSSAIVHGKLMVEIEDSGRGVDWQAVKAAAQKLGVPSATEEELVRAMFAPGLSTSAEVTTISGRGIGLSAVRQQVNDLGGHIAVISKPSQGTCFRFTFPLPDIGPRFGVDAPSDGSKTGAAA